MLRKSFLALLSLCFLFLFAVPVYADNQISTATQSQSTTQTTTQPDTGDSTSSGPLSALAKDDMGLHPLTPINFDSLGNKAVNFGNRSFELLRKGSIPLFVWAIGGSIVVLLFGIFFGKRVILAGVIGILISIAVVVMIPYTPQIVISVKNAIGSALTP